MEFLESADSRETDQELIAAIWQVSGRSHAEAIRVWEAPTPAEIVAIVEIVTNNGLGRPTTDFCWGAVGTGWASEI